MSTIKTGGQPYWPPAARRRVCFGGSATLHLSDRGRDWALLVADKPRGGY
jgi:hypothetical protein